MRSFEHARWVNAIAYAADGRTLFVADDGALHAWNLETGERSIILQRGRKPKPIRSVALSADGRWLAAGCQGLILCRVGPIPPPSDRFSLSRSTEEATQRILTAPGWTATDFPATFPATDTDITFSPDSKLIARTDRDRIFLSQVETGKHVGGLVRRGLFLSAPAFAPDGKTLAFFAWFLFQGTVARRVLLWDLKRRERCEELATGPLEGNPLYSPDSRWLAVTDGAEVTMYELGSGQPVRAGSLHNPTQGPGRFMAFSPDSKYLLTGARDRVVRLWDVESRNLLEAWDWGVGQATCVAFAPDGMTAAVGGNRQVVVWDLDFPT
jgi:WD40 repeat protein